MANPTSPEEPFGTESWREFGRDFETGTGSAMTVSRAPFRELHAVNALDVSRRMVQITFAMFADDFLKTYSG